MSAELWPVLEGIPEKSVVSLRSSIDHWADHESDVRETLESQFHPLLVDADGAAVAAWLDRGEAGREWWSLPSEVSKYEPWLRVLIHRWRDIDPDRFPVLHGGFESSDWQTKAEREATAALNVLEEEKADFEREHAARKKHAEARVRRASDEAARTSRCLLTETGAALEVAVEAALTLIGFGVEARDGSGRQLREDFRIREPGDADWVALVEVKGLTNGASPSVFGQASRHEVNYAAEEGKRPSAVVIVINHFRERSPEERPGMFESHQEEVKSFAENGYRVLDTRDLFVALRDVEEGLRTVAEVRRVIREGIGVIDLASREE